MVLRNVMCFVALCASSIFARGQQISAPEPQTGSITGVALDVDGALVPGALVTAQGPEAADKRTAKSDDSGVFEVKGIRPLVPYTVTISLKGFADWVSPPAILSIGQRYVLSNVKLLVGAVTDTVSAETSEQIAIEMVTAEEHQRVFGVIPNFYVVYASTTTPLSAKLKYKLALRSIIDPVNLAAAAFLAGLQQASDTPDYVQGAKGYGQRVGAAYANGLTDIFFGGAVYPAMFHQDPRYFFQGTGTKKSRTIHALGSPFVCRGDNGKRQFNWASVAGDLTSGAISETYYPAHQRGPGLVFETAALTTGGRMVNAILQEFVLSRFTSKAKVQK